MTILIKLGGSLITDKSQPRAFRRQATRAVLQQIASLVQSPSPQKIIIGHGSGSFGHYEAQKHNTIAGLRSPEQWRGFTQVAEAASALSQLILRECVALNLPVLRFQPSAMMQASRGSIQSMNPRLLLHALNSGLIPLVHGDVAFDEHLGGTIISTELIFAELLNHIPVERILLLGETDGVLDHDGNPIKRITPNNFHTLKPALSGARGYDVTGGMLQKVEAMLSLVRANPDLQVLIASGRQPNSLCNLLLHDRPIGTIITAN